MAQTLGLISVIWRGSKIKIDRENSSVSLGGLVQEEIITGQQVDYANVFKTSVIQATTVVERGQSILSLYAPGQGELQVQCDTGQTYTWPDAFLTGEPKFQGGKGGRLKLEWKAGTPTEVLNG
jgi:hypothetical protein